MLLLRRALRTSRGGDGRRVRSHRRDALVPVAAGRGVVVGQDPSGRRATDGGEEEGRPDVGRHRRRLLRLMVSILHGSGLIFLFEEFKFCGFYKF